MALGDEAVAVGWQAVVVDGCLVEDEPRAVLRDIELDRAVCGRGVVLGGACRAVVDSCFTRTVGRCERERACDHSDDRGHGSDEQQ